jgi:hypothetical protein
VTELLAGGFAEALDVVMVGAPRTGAVSMLAAVELRCHPDGLSCTALARGLRRRLAGVVHALEDERRFARSGSTCGARWTLARAHGTELNALRGADATSGPPETTRVRRAA